jgi:sugar O-acyltransferase (sialic acid O-acetyltransferase NeuD family)
MLVSKRLSKLEANVTAFIGFGLFAKQIVAMAEIDQASPDFVVFDDVAYAKGCKLPRTLPYYALESNLKFISSAYVGLGYKHLAERERVMSLLHDCGIPTPSIVHGSSVVMDSAVLNSATYVYPGSIIDQNVILGSGVVLNNRVTVSHDSVVGDCCFIAPSVTICGNVTIGRRSFIGAGAVITNDVRIGDDVSIGAGTLVTKDVTSGVSVIGNPMRVLTSRLRLL